MLKAVLFDLDNTLIDWDATESWQEFGLRRMTELRDLIHAQMFPLPHLDAFTMFTTFVQEMDQAWSTSSDTLIAPDFKRALAATLSAHDIPVDRLDLDVLMRAYRWGLVEGERLYPDVLEVLPVLRARGIELGIVTNASQSMRYRDHELHELEIVDFFPRCRIAAVDVGVIKPHPAIFEYALNLLRIGPHEAVFVGDNLLADIKGAQGAGMYAVWRRGPDAEKQLAEHDGRIVPDGTIYTLHDLLPLLDGWFPGWRNGAMS